MKTSSELVKVLIFFATKHNYAKKLEPKGLLIINVNENNFSLNSVNVTKTSKSKQILEIK